MLSIVNKPPGIILSKSPAWFSVQQSPDGPRQIRAKLMDGASEVGSLYSYATINDIAHFELSELIDSAVSAEFSISPFSPGIVHPLVGNIIKNLSVVFSDNTNSETSTSFTALKGTVSPDLFAFAQYAFKYETLEQYVSENPILSLKPPDLYVYHANQPERLYLYAHDAINVSVHASLYLHKGGEIHEEVASFSAVKNFLYEIDTSFSSIVQPFISGANNSCSLYRIRLYSGHLPVSKWYNYHCDLNAATDGCFVFQNSLGGFDTLCPTGELSIRSQRAHDASQVVATPFKKQYNQTISNLKTNILLSRNTGNLPASYVPFLQQLLFSPKVYWVQHGEDPAEITISDSNINIADKQGDLVSARIPYFFNPQLKAEQQ